MADRRPLVSQNFSKGSLVGGGVANSSTPPPPDHQILPACFAYITWCTSPVNNGCPACPGDSVVVRFTQTADGADVGLGQVVHGEIAEALLCDDHVWLVLDDLGARFLDPILLQFQKGSPAKVGV
jgi:hypothetical protein